MKKLIAMMMVVCAAVCAQADLVLYWNVKGNTTATAEGYNYALLYSATTESNEGAWTTPDSYLEGIKKGASSSGTYTFTAPTSGDLFFYVALANYDVSADTISILKTTEAVSYSTLKEQGYIGTDTQASPNTWAGGTFSVPEPTSGLLLCLGTALLALKRKRV